MQSFEMHIIDRQSLEKIYTIYNRKKYISPDPLQFLSEYKKIEDREIVGLIASSLAYGRVSQILVSVGKILNLLGHRPKNFITASRSGKFSTFCKDFKHRFTSGCDIADFLSGIRKVLHLHGTLHDCFLKGYNPADKNILPAMTFFVKELKGESFQKSNTLLPDPEKKSACKRLNLYLRWMVRKDKVDPGGWAGVDASKLIIPLDTHMHRFGSMYNFTARINGDLKTALEVTEGFRMISPEDPVKYDFSITRFGIRNELNFDNLNKLFQS